MINIVFLCHEITKGMKSFGPKALIPVGKKNKTIPLIIKQINNVIKNYKDNEYKLHVVVGFEHERVVKALKDVAANVNIIRYDKYHTTNSSGAVIHCLKQIGGGNFLFIDNGIVISYKPSNLNKSIIPIIKQNSDIDNTFGIGATISDNRIEYLFYDLPTKWSEIIYLSKSDYDLILDLCSKKSLDHMFLFEMINFLIESKLKFFTDYINNTKITKIINYKSYNHVNIHSK